MIQIDELKYRYSDSAVWALRDTSFSVGNGELIVLTGKSGCGKSTLFRCINGLCPNFFEGEKAGGVFLMGKEISLMRIGDISKMPLPFFRIRKVNFSQRMYSLIWFSPVKITVYPRRISRRVWTV